MNITSDGHVVGYEEHEVLEAGFGGDGDASEEVGAADSSPLPRDERTGLQRRHGDVVAGTFKDFVDKFGWEQKVGHRCSVASWMVN